MRPLRLVLVTRRFWPLVGGAEVLMGKLATEFLHQGARPIVVTGQWEKSWPQYVEVCDVPVVRLPQPAGRGWGTARYMFALARWLRHHRRDMDLVYVSMLKHDAYTAVAALHQHAPRIILRAEGAGLSGDCHWQSTAKMGRRIRARCRQADRVVALSNDVENELIQAGYPRSIIHQIPNGVQPGIERTRQRRMKARAALGTAHSDLKLADDTLLAVYTGRLHRDKGLEILIDSWRIVSDRWSRSKLWILGEGEERDTLQSKIRAMGLDGRILLPGVFDSIDDVLRSADLFVLPSFQEGMSIALLEALSNGLPCVVTDIPGNRAVLADQQHGVLVPPRDSAALAEAIIHLWERPAAAWELGSVAQQYVQSRFSLAKVADQHLQLFRQLLDRK